MAADFENAESLGRSPSRWRSCRAAMASRRRSQPPPDAAVEIAAYARCSMARITLPQVVERLQSHYGQPEPPRLAGPWEMVLWENVAYLADDDRRLQAFQTLKKRPGAEPARILSASEGALLEVTRHGIMPEQFAGK